MLRCTLACMQRSKLMKLSALWILLAHFLRYSSLALFALQFQNSIMSLIWKKCSKHEFWSSVRSSYNEEPFLKSYLERIYTIENTNERLSKLAGYVFPPTIHLEYAFFPRLPHRKSFWKCQNFFKILHEIDSLKSSRNSSQIMK